MVQNNKKIVVFLLLCNIVFVYIGAGLILPIMPQFIHVHGLDNQVAGYFVSVYALAQLIFSPILGKLSDKIGRKKLIVCGMIINGVSQFLFGFTNQLFLLYVARMLGGIGAALITPSVIAYVTDITTKEDRGKYIGYFNAAITAGFIIGPAIGGYVVDLGLFAPFLAAGSAAFIAAIGSIIFLKEPTHTSGNVHNNSKDNLFIQIFQSYKLPYFFGLLIVFISMFVLGSFDTIFGLYTNQRFHFSTKQIASVHAISALVITVVQFFWFSRILRKFGEWKVVRWCLAIASIGMIVNIFVVTYLPILVVATIVFLAVEVMRPAISTWITNHADGAQGFAAGMSSSFSSLGNVLGPFSAGLFFGWNIHLPYITCAFVFFIFFIAVTLFVKMKKDYIQQRS